MMFRYRDLLTVILLMSFPLPQLWADAPSVVDGSASPMEADDDSDETPFVAPEDTNVRLVYSVNRVAESPFETSRAVQVLTRDDIWRRGARTLPEVLMEEAGVFVQQTNYGGGSPIIRGLVGKQILILIDGVRLNNGVYRFGPIQYLATIDLSSVERIEIVRGVGSVLGSDALGGTINIITRKGPPAAEEVDFKASVYTRYSTADEALTGHVEFSGRADKYRYIAGGTFRTADDLEAGGDVGLQPGTGYDELGAHLGLEYFIGTERTFSVSYLTLEQDEVPRTDRITSGRNLLFNFDPQRLQVFKLSYLDSIDRSWTEAIQATFYWNRQDEGRQEIRSSQPSVERFLADSQSTLGFNLEFRSFQGKSHRLVYGIDFSTDDIDSRREDLNLETGDSEPKRGQYTDGSTYDIFATYLQDRFDVGEILTVTLGARYSTFSAEGTEESSVGTLDLSSSDDSLTGALSFVVHANEHLNIIAQATRGFRAPNIDDISIFDERPDGTEVPNPGLEAEEIVTYEAGLKVSSAAFSGSAFYHVSDLSDLLVRAPGTINGLPFFDLDGDAFQDPGEPNVLQKKNLGQATIEGFELDWSYSWRTIRFLGNYTYTLGDDDLENVPLRRVPPAFATLRLRWVGAAARRPWAELVYQHADSQRRLNPQDESDSRIGPEGTDGFDVIHLRGGLWLTERLRGTLAFENVFDELYKYHASGLFRPGLHLVAQIEFNF